ncbi:unnamed protein product [Urochloa humidicola]
MWSQGGALSPPSWEGRLFLTSDLDSPPLALTYAAQEQYSDPAFVTVCAWELAVSGVHFITIIVSRGADLST